MHTAHPYTIASVKAKMTRCAPKLFSIEIAEPFKGFNTHLSWNTLDIYQLRLCEKDNILGSWFIWVHHIFNSKGSDVRLWLLHWSGKAEHIKCHINAFLGVWSVTIGWNWYFLLYLYWLTWKKSSESVCGKLKVSLCIISAYRVYVAN